MKLKKTAAVLCAAALTVSAFIPFGGFDTSAYAARQMEDLGRGVVAVRTGKKSAFISWRSLGLDSNSLGFNIYRVTDGKTVKLNSSVITDVTNYTDTGADLSKDTSYYVKTVENGKETDTSNTFTISANSAYEPCYTVPLKSGSEIRNVWVGDLDGDGEYDYIVSRKGTQQSIEAYKSDGTYLWTLSYGKNSENQNNISPGSATIDVGMWDGLTVYDVNGDGKAEVITKIANGVTFGDGAVWSNKSDTKQWIAVVDGMTGSRMCYSAVPDDYISAGPVAAQLGIAYLDGTTPSIIASMKNRNSDKSFNMMVCAYKMSGSKLKMQWQWNRGNQDLADGHQMRIADVDGDGKDEICHIGFTLESDGSLKYSLTKKGVVHGDRFYVGKFDKNGPIRGYGIQQNNDSGLLDYYYNASNGNITWKHYTSSPYDVGRGDCGDIDPNYAGWEIWAFDGIYNGPKNIQITTADNQPYPSIAMWWDGDLLREQVNTNKIEKWDYQTQSVKRLVTAYKFHNATLNDRNMPLFVGDIVGDWREEVVYSNSDYSELVIFTTNIPTEYKLYTLAHNPLYRNCMTIKGYVESHTLDYYLGADMNMPSSPDIYVK